MSKLTNISPRKEAKVGINNIIGGENLVDNIPIDGLKEISPKMKNSELKELLKIINSKLSSGVKEVKTIHRRRKTTYKVVKFTPGELMVLEAKKQIIIDLLNSRKAKPRNYSKCQITADIKYEVVTKQPMINPLIMDYEVESEVVKMNYPRIIKRTNELGKEEELILFGPKSVQRNERELCQKDILTLFNSNLLYLKDGKGKMVELKKAFESVKPHRIHVESDILPSLKYYHEKYGIFTKMRNTYIPLNEVQRISLETGNCRTRQSIAYTLQLKGDLGDTNALKACAIRAYNQETFSWEEPEARSYNFLNYEDNKVVIFSNEKIINSIEENFNKLNGIDKNYEENWKKGFVLKQISKDEEKVLKNFEHFGKIENPKKRVSNDLIEASEVINEEFLDEYVEELEIVSKLDGRQSVSNLEYDLRNHPQIKSFRNETSSKLFFLIKELENNSYEGLGISEKKYIAFKNVLLSFKMEKELEEDESEYLFEQLDEDDKRYKSNRFFDIDNYKTHRNYYNQVGGVLKPYGHPQITHRRISNPPSLKTLRVFRKGNRNVLVGKFAGISDPEVLCKIYTGPSPNIDYNKDFFRSLDEEYERVFRVKTPTPSTSYVNQNPTSTKDYIIHKYGFKNLEEAINGFEIIEELFGKTKDSQMILDTYRDDEILHLCLGKTHYEKDNTPLPGEKGLTDKEFKEKYCSKEQYIPPIVFPAIPTRNTVDEFIDMSGDIPHYISSKRKLEDVYEIIKENNGIYIIRTKIDNSIKFLYAKGNLEALRGDSISYAGTRKPSRETMNYIKKVVQVNSQNYVIISGLAQGCDEITHNTCLNNKGITIAVLPCGFNHVNNHELAQEIIDNNGLLLSEYAPSIKPHKRGNEWSYISRNKIIAGLSDKVIIFEAGNGTKKTYDFARGKGKQIFVQPCKANEDKKLKSIMMG